MANRSVYICPNSPLFFWELHSTISHEIAVAVTSVACPVIIVLNILVILAVMTRKELKKKSTILLASLAFSDLLVGAVSMPVTITLDSRALQKRFAENSFCAIDIVNDFFMYATFGASFFHLLVIAWERYVAVHKWSEYKVIVTINRIRKYVALALVVALLTVVPKVAVATVPARWELMFAADILISTVYFICLLLIGYFYVMVYRGVRRWNRSPFRQVDALIKSKLETKTAFTTFCITVFAAASLVPSFAVLVLGRTVAPFLRMSSYFRWAGIFLQLNSLINPVPQLLLQRPPF